MTLELKLRSKEEARKAVIKQLQTSIYVALLSEVSIDEIKDILALICPVDKDGKKVDWGKVKTS
jgi:hypothetical protein